MHSFCELAPKLITEGQYLLSEVFFQDPLERYFSKQRHRWEGNEIPTVAQFYTNSAIIMQRQQIRSDLATMNVEPTTSTLAPTASALQPLPINVTINNRIIVTSVDITGTCKSMWTLHYASLICSFIL